MALSPSGGVAGYAPATAITRTIDRYRDVGFAGQPITDATLQKIGISESLIPRTLASLRVLDLIDAEGKPTDQFDVLKNATTAEFSARLAEWLKDTYAPIFGFCDPTAASPAEIEDAFRGYTPEGQRTRMANLFLGLAAYAGIIEEAPSKPRGRHAPQPKNTPKIPAEPARRKKLSQHMNGADTAPKPTSTIDAARARYVEMLMDKAAGQDEVSSELLDRIERALGIALSGGDSS